MRTGVQCLTGLPAFDDCSADYGQSDCSSYGVNPFGHSFVAYEVVANPRDLRETRRSQEYCISKR